MAFLESPRFPEKISFGATGGPEFKTDIAAVLSGVETRNRNWTQARLRYDVAHAARLPEQYNTLRSFFYAVGGMASGFRFKDWSDYTVTASQGVLVLVSGSIYQLYKRYSAGSTNYDRIIQKPISPITVTGGSVASISYTTGRVTMTSGTPTASRVGSKSWAPRSGPPVRTSRSRSPDREHAHA